ncbi:hypothetical protein AAHC03_013197 [Spirometra sp. Aus1]
MKFFLRRYHPSAPKQPFGFGSLGRTFARCPTASGQVKTTLAFVTFLTRPAADMALAFTMDNFDLAIGNALQQHLTILLVSMVAPSQPIRADALLGFAMPTDLWTLFGERQRSALTSFFNATECISHFNHLTTDLTDETRHKEKHNLRGPSQGCRCGYTSVYAP